MTIAAFSLQSSVCAKIMEMLGQNKIDHRQRQVATLSQDSFYKVLTPEQKAKAVKGQFNFDHPGTKTQSECVSHICLSVSMLCFFVFYVYCCNLLCPDAFDNELILKTLHDIIQGKTVQIPVYDFVTHSRYAFCLVHLDELIPAFRGYRVSRACLKGLNIKSWEFGLLIVSASL